MPCASQVSGSVHASSTELPQSEFVFGWHVPSLETAQLQHPSRHVETLQQTPSVQ